MAPGVVPPPARHRLTASAGWQPLAVVALLGSLGAVLGKRMGTGGGLVAQTGGGSGSVAGPGPRADRAAVPRATPAPEARVAPRAAGRV